MPTTIDAIELQVKNDSSNASKGIDSLTASLGKLKTATKNGAGLTSVINQLNKVKEATDDSTIEKLGKFGEAMEKLSSLGKLKISPAIANQITKIGQAISTLPETDYLTQTVDAIEKLSALKGATFPDLGLSTPTAETETDTSAVTDTADGMSDAVDTINQYEDKVDGASIKTSKLKAILASLGGVFRKTGETGVDSFVKQTSQADILKMKLEGAKQKLQGLLTSGETNSPAVANLVSQIKSLEVELQRAKGESTTFFAKLKDAASAKIKSGFENIKNKIKQIGTHSGKASGKLGRFLGRLKSIALYRAIRFFFSQLTQAMKEGINNLYQYSNVMGGTFKSSMDRLATSFQYLKNSMVAMVAPLINALAPAIDFVIDKFVALINVMNQFFARLTGASTFTAAKKQATSYGDSISGAGGAAKKAAKEIKDATLGIDELNIISQPDDDSSGGGGGGASSDFGSMFEDLPIDNSVSSFTDKLKEAFNNGDWLGLGTLLGEKFNEMVDNVPWKNIGSKIGGGINGAIQTAYGFLHTADFTNLGSRIADMLNSGIEKIDFTYAGKLLVRGITAACDLGIGFITTFDWGQLARKLGDGIKGAFNEASKWIQGIDWGKLADTLWGQVKNVFKNIDYAGLAKSFFEFLGSAIGATVSFFGTLLVDIGTDIWEAIRKVFVNEDGSKKTGEEIWNGVCEGIKNAITNVGTWIKENIFQPFIDGFKKAFGIHSPSTVMAEQGKLIVEGLIKGIKDHINDGIATVKLWASKVIDWFTGGDGNGNIFQKFKGFASDIITGFGDKISGTYTTVKSRITTWASSVKNWFTSNGFGGINSTTFATYANNTINGFKDKISTAYTNTKSSITTWANNVKTWFTSSSFGGVNAENFKTFANNTITGFKDKISSAYTNTKSSITTWASNVKTWFTSSSHGGVNAETFKTYASNVITGFKDKISSSYTTVKSSITTWASNIKTWFSGSSDGAINSTTFSNYATNVINGFKDKISTTYTNVKSSITTWASGVKDWFTGSGYGNVNSTQFGTYASNVLDGFKNKISNSYTNTKSSITTWASSIKTWFTEKCSSSTFYNVASDVIDGFKNGIGDLYYKTKSTVQGWAASIKSWFEDKLDIGSPSKVFYKIGGFTVAGFNNAITEEGRSTRDIIRNWADSFSGFQPQLAYGFAVDTSALDYYNADSYMKDIQTDVTTHGTFTATGFKEGMEEFYHEWIEPTFVRMADDMRRQADKEEKTVVQVGNRTISDAVTTQKNANGYSFTK